MCFSRPDADVYANKKDSQQTMSGMKLKDRMRNTSVRQKTACMI
jgi:hypothetical protein